MSIALSAETALPEMELGARPHSGADVLMIVVMDGSSGAADSPTGSEIRCWYFARSIVPCFRRES